MAIRRNEEMIVDINVFVEGLGLLGVATEFTSANPELSTLESEASPAGKMELVYGAMEAMEMEFTLGEHNVAVHTAMGKLNDATIIAKQSAKQGKDDVSVEWIHKGSITTIEGDASKRGEKSKNSVKMKVHYFMKRINGKSVCEVDKMNGVCKPDGEKDVLEVARNFVSKG